MVKCQVAVFFVSLCLVPAWCQSFSFPSPITFQTSCCSLVANLSVDGMVTLSSEDLDNDHFLPTVYIQTTSEICTIDLSSCSLTGPPPGGNICGCANETDTKFLLYVRKQINASESGQVLQAALHHHVANNPTIVTSNIGRLWPVESLPKGHVVSTLGDGSTVLTDTTTDGGGWVVIQRRSSAAVDFYRNWQNYTDGFGDVHNFWLGLNKIHQMCNTTCELRIDMTFNCRDYHATYREFSISDAASFFTLHVGQYEGDAGDMLRERHHPVNGHPFSTKDQDHSCSCATTYLGAWWYNCCHYSNLNGHWGDTASGKGLTWYSITDVDKSLSYVEMKVRPANSANIDQVVIGK